MELSLTPAFLQLLPCRMQEGRHLHDSTAPHLQAAQLEREPWPQLLQARTHCRRRLLLPLVGLLLLLKDIPMVPASSRA